jgi:hypothetical protein
LLRRNYGALQQKDNYKRLFFPLYPDLDTICVLAVSTAGGKSKESRKEDDTGNYRNSRRPGHIQ